MDILNRIIMLIAAILNSLPIFHAGSELSVASTQESAYFTRQTVILGNGTSLEQLIIHGPPTPPPGYELQRAPVSLPQVDPALAISSLSVPAYKWSFGCSATSGAMIAGYLDRNGFSNIYSGPTNGGVMPLDSSPWPYWTDGVGDTYAQCPLTATRNGLDGRTMRGSMDDYWVSYLGGVQDPYITNGWAEHTWGEAIGDYMKTSQSNYDNDDGSTSFYTFTSSASPLTCTAMEGYNISQRDGTYGRKLFYEARGYSVTDCYNQKTDNIKNGGFSFAQYKAEIEAGRPVMLNLAGHTIVGVGYDDASNSIYLHDTWDYATHSMVWGGSYSGMQLESVSIVNLQIGMPTSTPTPTMTATYTPSRTNTSTFTPTYSPTSTPSKTNTPTHTPSQTNTATFTPSQTNTSTFTPTHTSTTTPSKTNTPTYTPSQTNTATFTQTNTATSTQTPTSTPSSTHTPLPTSSPTLTPTSTHTLTDTPTSTPSWTVTASFTPTYTQGYTPTFTPTFTSIPSGRIYRIFLPIFFRY